MITFRVFYTAFLFLYMFWTFKTLEAIYLVNFYVLKILNVTGSIITMYYCATLSSPSTLNEEHWKAGQRILPMPLLPRYGDPALSL